MCKFFCPLKLARGFKWIGVLPAPATRVHYNEAQYQALKIKKDNLLLVLMDKAGKSSTPSTPPQSQVRGPFVSLRFFYIVDASVDRCDVSELTQFTTWLLSRSPPTVCT